MGRLNLKWIVFNLLSLTWWGTPSSKNDHRNVEFRRFDCVDVATFYCFCCCQQLLCYLAKCAKKLQSRSQTDVDGAQTVDSIRWTGGWAGPWKWNRPHPLFGTPPSRPWLLQQVPNTKSELVRRFPFLRILSVTLRCVIRRWWVHSSLVYGMRLSRGRFVEEELMLSSNFR